MWKKIAFVVLGLAAFAGASTAALSLRPELFSTLFADGGSAITRDVQYGAHPRQQLDIYRPARGGDGPVAVFIYGGGWRSGERATYGFVGAALASRGITVVIPDYRLYPQAEFPDWVEDAALAYAWTLRNTRGLCGGRPPVVIGHSAGAHTGALLSLDRRYLQKFADIPQPCAFIGLAGPYAFDPTSWPTTKEIFQGAKSEDARPLLFARPDAPPSLLIHGGRDEDVRIHNQRDLAVALLEKGATVQTFEPDDVGHIGLILAMSRPFRWRAPVLDETVTFINRNIRCAEALHAGNN